MSSTQKRTANANNNAYRPPPNQPANTSTNSQANASRSPANRTTSPIRSTSPNTQRPANQARPSTPNQARPAPAAPARNQSTTTSNASNSSATSPARNRQKRNNIIKGVITLALLIAAGIGIYLLSQGSGSGSNSNTYYPHGRPSNEEPEPEPVPEPIIEAGQTKTIEYSLNEFLPLNFDIRKQPGTQQCDFQTNNSNSSINRLHWSNILSSIIKDTNCLEGENKSEYPSNYYLMNCSPLSNKQRLTSIQEFNTIMKAAKQGLPSNDCFDYSSENEQLAGECNEICKDGSQIQLTEYSFENLRNAKEDSHNIENVKAHLFSTGPALALLQIDSRRFLSGQFISQADSASTEEQIIDEQTEYYITKVFGWEQTDSTSEWLVQNPLSSKEELIHISIQESIIQGIYGFIPSHFTETA